jgi:hypothetical protein
MTQNKKIARIALVHIENFSALALSHAEKRDSLSWGSPECRDENDSAWDNLNSTKEWIDLGKDATLSQSGADWDPSLSETFDILGRSEFDTRVASGAFPDQNELRDLNLRARLALEQFDA